KSDVIAEAELVRKSVEACDSRPKAPCVAFVSKMFTVPIKMLPQRDVNGDIVTNYHEESGSGDFDECESVQKHIQEAELHSLYLMMGQCLKPVATARAGNIVAIRGLGQHILKSATLASTKNCWPFSSMTFQVSPTLKVAIELSDPADMAALMKGLRHLNRADPFVEISVSARGEHVLAAAGEVHLERCVRILKVQVYAKGFKTLTGSSNLIERVTPNGRCTVRVYIMKLPDALTKFLDESSDLLEDVIAGKAIRAQDDEHPVESSGNDWEQLKVSADGNTDKDIDKYKLLWEDLLKRIWALGPRQVGPNHCICPLCDEPMWGLAFVVEASVSPFVSESEAIHQQSQTDQYGVFSGQVMTAVKEACKAAVIQRNPRIVEGMYFCELNTPTEHLANVYKVLGRRRAKILKEEMQEGSPLFMVHAYVPVAESFGFADDLRSSTSGACSALLVLSHWEVLPEDPFFVPKTEEEKEEFGDGSSVLQNTARKLIDSVRRRKGLPVEEKVVQHATKQRTRARKV
ncbi:elongation factor-like GTPase 1, partial [Tanacetum coccineum]